MIELAAIGDEQRTEPPQLAQVLRQLRQVLQKRSLAYLDYCLSKTLSPTLPELRASPVSSHG